ncbi:hypothetical protein [Oceanispirochaeta sp. M1]|uniref:IS66 family insertion sequence element accessory protein TnpA n=1 Tax=Oceanispirochaeta sp. M1 TaxID=2283433 RepID=UPI000E099B4E|nr:hypothetical protein [Oceanispirochaeta sp. M1]NPD75579.1 hypothetical protein [Oceanispirochaeta sp. M1]RDG28558.1 hypothetical protein DV872_26230 [Oceanispirochaeta sp. M1]
MKRRTSEDWDHIIRDYKESGLTQKKYCHRNNLNYWTLRDQRIKRESDVPKKKLVRIAPEKSINQVPESDVSSNSEIVKITFPSGIFFEIPTTVNNQCLQFFIATLWSLK